MKIDVTEYWSNPPPVRSQKVDMWLGRFKAGWKPNRRINQMGWEERIEFFKVSREEYMEYIYPEMLRLYNQTKEKK